MAGAAIEVVLVVGDEHLEILIGRTKDKGFVRQMHILRVSHRLINTKWIYNRRFARC